MVVAVATQLVPFNLSLLGLLVSLTRREDGDLISNKVGVLKEKDRAPKEGG